MGIKYKNSNEGWGLVSILLHWITALSVFIMFAFGIWMTGLEYYDSWYRSAPFMHKSVGILLFFLIFIRFIWRIFNKTPKPLGNHTKLEKFMARSAHFLLYALLLFTIMFGYLMSTADGRSVSVFGWFDVPSLITSIPNQGNIAGELHESLAWLLVILAVLHGIAAIKHHFIDKDNTLIRMLKFNNKS